MTSPNPTTAHTFLSLLGLQGMCPAYWVLIRNKPDKTDVVKLKIWEDNLEHEIFHWHQFDRDWPKAKWVGLIVYFLLWIRTEIKTVLTFKLQEHPMEAEAHENMENENYWKERGYRAWA